MMAAVEPRAVEASRERLEDAVERRNGAVLGVGHTLPRRHAGSKPAERVGISGHEVSKPLK